MSNQYFQFKQFIVQQDKCAMKVSTDACIQGAYTPVLGNVKRVLDIGTGTGLLALMLAQRAINITVDAIELDQAAAGQAAENVALSPFGQRISVLNFDINMFKPQQQYDLVICNPPFFNDGLLGHVDSRNKARHTITLTHAQLIDAIKSLLEKDGYASVLLPALQQPEWERSLLQQGFCMYRRLFIKPYEFHKPNRIVSIFGLKQSSCVDDKMVIYRAQGQYTSASIDLLEPFYLKEMQ